MATKHFLSNSRGVTMAEIMIALAINSIIILAVVSLVSNTMISGKSSQNRQELATDFALLQNYFAREIPNAGGMSIPTDSSFWVENNCSSKVPSFPNCKGSDRLTILTSDEGPVCTITSWNAVTATAQLNTVVSAGVPVCCLDSRPTELAQVLFTSGFDFAQRFVTKADHTACTAVFGLGPMAPHDNTIATYDWKGGIIIPVHVDAFYLDVDATNFYRYTYSDTGPQPTSGTSQVLADRVFDFQAMLGFDFNPADGVVVDTSSDTDEWLYNSPSETITTGVFSKLSTNQLRMIGIGWVIGTPSGGGASGATSASILDGPVRSKAGYIFQSGVVKLGARSVFVYD